MTLDAVQVIARVAEVVRRVEHEQRAAALTAITSVAAVVTSRAPELVEAARAEDVRTQERARITPVDPDELQWDPFELFGRQEKETAWTQWLSGCLRAERGSTVASLVWGAMCKAVVDADRRSDGADSSIAQVMDWQAASLAPPRDVLDEVADPEGRPDIVVYTDRFVLVLENKLWAGWHDRSDAPQASSYEALGRRRANAAGSKLALVLLTCREDMTAPAPWVVITYPMLAARLRLLLQQALAPGVSSLEFARLMPALVTVRAIERHLIEGSAPRARRDDPVAELLEHVRYQRAAEGL